MRSVAQRERQKDHALFRGMAFEGNVHLDIFLAQYFGEHSLDYFSVQSTEIQLERYSLCAYDWPERHWFGGHEPINILEGGC